MTMMIYYKLLYVTMSYYMLLYDDEQPILETNAATPHTIGHAARPHTHTHIHTHTHTHHTYRGLDHDGVHQLRDPHVLNDLHSSTAQHSTAKIGTSSITFAS